MLQSRMDLSLLKSMTLLYIEDEPLIRQNAVEYLSSYCREIYEAEDGVQGLEAYETHKPDIIITDIKMPKLNGIEMAKQIRTQDRHTPIIIATAHTETEYLLEAVNLQLIKYIVKPITADKLQDALSLACEVLSENISDSTLKLDSTTRYDTLNKTLFADNHLIKLAHNEMLLLDLLVSNRQRIVTYEEIEALIWGYEGMSKDALRTLVRSLRKKIGEQFIKNISGTGYKLTIV